jgi:hypothetical protein
MLTKMTNFLRQRFPTASISVHAYDQLSSAGARLVKKQSESMTDEDARRHVFLYTGFSTEPEILATQTASETNVATFVIWQWKQVLQAFTDNAGIYRAAYACDRFGLLFHHFWLRASFLKSLPKPSPHAFHDYFRHWLEQVRVLHKPASLISWQNAQTVSLCNSDGDGSIHGSCHDVDFPGAYSSTAFLSCACPNKLRQTRMQQDKIENMGIDEAVAFCGHE